MALPFSPSQAGKSLSTTAFLLQDGSSLIRELNYLAGMLPAEEAGNSCGEVGEIWLQAGETEVNCEFGTWGRRKREALKICDPALPPAACHSL